MSNTPDLLLDENISWRVARGLRAQGFSVITTSEAGLSGKLDNEVFLYAKAHQLVIVSRDSDFATRFAPPHAGIIHVLVPGSAKNIEILRCLESNLPAILAQPIRDTTRAIDCVI